MAAAATQACIGICDLADSEVIRRVLAGEREVFEAFIRRYSQRLYRIALSLLRDPSEAEDVVQDTFVSAYRNLAQFSGRARLIAWLSRIAVNHSLSRLSSRVQELPISDGEVFPLQYHLADSTPGPEEHLSARESSEGLRKALATLSETHRNVLILRDLNELDTRTVAKRLGISEENVKVRLHRARRRLRSALSADPRASLARSAPARACAAAAVSRLTEGSRF
jgi:RNA polymerase sigma-70 factor (ECF subfamily)